MKAVRALRAVWIAVVLLALLVIAAALMGYSPTAVAASCDPAGASLTNTSIAGSR